MELFAATAPGIEEVTARELKALGLSPSEVIPGGVVFSGELDAVARANVGLRTASRVLVRLGSFTARTFAELERHAAKLDWSPFVPAGGAATFRVTARKCRLFHTGAIAERLARIAGVEQRDGEGGEVQPFVVRGVRDEWLVSADSSGELLHRRGYRLATARAPLRETLAAAALLASGWDRSSPLIDPFCGSGTICIEGAMLALDIAPGSRRRFAFQQWPAALGVVSARVTGRTRPAAEADRHAPLVHGYDRDAGAIQSATDNAARAGVAAATQFAQQAISAFDPPARPGWIVTNPPYGVRVGERGALRDLYARFGAVVRERCSGWRVLFFSAEPALERATGLHLEPVLRTENGGLPVRLVRSEV